jgi:uncharacterized membrane protein YeaQ/YmgE (transglycosylase-associated protein family)
VLDHEQRRLLAPIIVDKRLLPGHAPISRVNAKGKGVNVNIILFLILGGVAGWLAGLIMKGRGFGILGNIVVGIIGGFLGGFLFGLIGVTSGSMLGSLLMAVVGAVVLLFIVGLLKKP